jgi:hypothetical protein
MLSYKNLETKKTKNLSPNSHQYVFIKSALLAILFFNSITSIAQATLNADGPGLTYELINSVLAPTGNAIEAPDQLPEGSHSSFGRHISEVLDTDLKKYVFEFYSHLNTGATSTLDNDISTTKTDRQRVEIKTYATSPENLKGTVGESVTYKWRFKIPVGFQPSSSFTHIHQIKPVDGDDSNPIFSLTARKGSPNKLEFNYVQSETSGTTKIATIDLALLEGVWVEVTENIKIATEGGSYDMLIKRVDNGTVLLSSSNNNILTIRPDNSFIRPKWGIYRSLLDAGSLRDETIRFSDFSISEATLSNQGFLLNPENEILFINPVDDSLILLVNAMHNYDSIRVYDIKGQFILQQKTNSTKIDVTSLKTGIYFVDFTKNGKSYKKVKMIKT